MDFLIFRLICYELPSKQTLETYLKQRKGEITARLMCLILHDIAKAIHYLTSKDVIHDAIVPKNILLVMLCQVGKHSLYNCYFVAMLCIALYTKS